jgi:hypothetical protein
MTLIWSQNDERIKINGMILSEKQDVEGVTVFNMSSNKGTITNSKGEFSIEVLLNDRIEVSALQFKPTLVVVDEATIVSKQLKIYLVEQVNQLGAVLLSYGLSGNLDADLDKVIKPTLFTINEGNMGALKYVDKAFDNKAIEAAYNTSVNKGQFYNGVNFNAISKMIFKSKKRESAHNINLNIDKENDVLKVYSPSTVGRMFNLPEEKVLSFINFLESKKINEALFKKENELKLIEYLIEQRKLFLEHDDDQN